MAKQEGQVYFESLQYMANEVAHTGNTQRAGDYIVGFAQEKAEGLYHLRNGELEWIEPDEENCHIEVAVLDATDHRFIPGLDIEATLLDADGEEVTTFDCPFLWHPGLYHYGRNVKVPGDGTYTLRIRIAAPTFPRHDKVNGKRYAEPVEVEFAGVQTKTGQG
jgi:hypothetical protein